MPNESEVQEASSCGRSGGALWQGCDRHSTGVGEARDEFCPPFPATLLSFREVNTPLKATRLAIPVANHIYALAPCSKVDRRTVTIRQRVGPQDKRATAAIVVGRLLSLRHRASRLMLIRLFQLGTRCCGFASVAYRRRSRAPRIRRDGVGRCTVPSPSRV